jgi:type IV pilus assembly protein PilW
MNARHLRRPQAAALGGQLGVSLVELMVAMVVSMLTVLVIINLMSSYGRQQRLGGSVNDAQNSAMIALNAIAQDLQSAGLGMSHQTLQDCANLRSSVDGTALPNFDVAAVSISDGGSGPDTVRVRYGESMRGDASVNLSANMSSPTGDMTVASSYGFAAGDVVLVTNDTNTCTLRKLTGVVTSSPPVLQAAATASPNYNPGGSPVGWVSYTTATASKVFALGKFTQRTYAVDSSLGALTAREVLETSSTPLAEGIVDMQAQYGITTSASSDQVTQWVNASAAPWVSPGAAERKRIKAIRIAVVARATEADASGTSSAAIVLWPAVAAGAGQQSAQQVYTPTGDGTKYRYRVLRMVVPLKNMMWAELS